MVLQRPLHSEAIFPRLWGVGPPGSQVSVKVATGGGHLEISGIPVLDDGTWSVTIAPSESLVPPLVGTGFTVEATNTGPEGESSVILSDVAFGEVWLCSGQSNMEWTINGVRDAQQVQYCWRNSRTELYDFHRRLTMQLKFTKMSG